MYYKNYFRQSKELATYKNRIEYFDIAKGIAILLVVLGHCRYQLIENFVCMFHMPVFLFVSGYFWKDEFITRPLLLISKRIKTLYLSYVKYEIAFFLLRPLFLYLSWYGEREIPFKFSIKFISIEICKIIIGMGREQLLGAFWYLITLMFIIIIFLVISFVTKKIQDTEEVRFIFVTIVFLIGCVLRDYIIVPRFGPALLGIVFYYAGYFVKNKGWNIWVSKMSIIVSMIVLIVCYRYGYCALGTCEITDPPFMIAVGGIGIYLVLAISKFVADKRKRICSLLSLFGANTIIVMAFHEVGFKLLTSLLYYSKIFNFTLEDMNRVPIGNNSLPYVIPYFLLAVIFCFFIIKIKKKMVPFLSGGN